MHTTSTRGRPRSPRLSVYSVARRGQRRYTETQLPRSQPDNIDDSSRKTTVNRQPRPRTPLTPRGIISDGPRYRVYVSKDLQTPSEIALRTFTLCSGRGRHQRARSSFRDVETPSDIAPASFTLCSGRQHLLKTDGTHSHSSHRDSSPYPANLSGGLPKIDATTNWTKSVPKDSFVGSSSFTGSSMSHSSQAKRSIVDKGTKARDYYPKSYASNSTSAAGHSK